MEDDKPHLRQPANKRKGSLPKAKKPKGRRLRKAMILSRVKISEEDKKASSIGKR
jgi:hypothetical protein